MCFSSSYHRDAIMKILIIYKSFHRMNTEKVAEAMADAFDATLMKVEDRDGRDSTAYRSRR